MTKLSTLQTTLEALRDASDRRWESNADDVAEQARADVRQAEAWGGWEDALAEVERGDYRAALISLEALRLTAQEWGDASAETQAIALVEAAAQSAAAAALGRKGGQAGTPAQLAQRRAAAVKGGRPALMLLVDDLGRAVGHCEAVGSRAGEIVEYGYRRGDGAFAVEGRARLVRTRPAERDEIRRTSREWTTQ